MPRKNPLPQHEQEICKRLKTFRETIRLSRVSFAQELQIDSAFLAAIEHCRAPLRYGIAYRIAEIFRINPDWLAHGSGSMTANSVLLAPPDSAPGLRDRSPFSSIYQQEKQRLSGGRAESFSNVAGEPGSVDLGRIPAPDTTAKLVVRPTPMGRLTTESLIVTQLRDWLVQVSNSGLNEFWNELVSSGQKLVARLGKLDPAAEAELRKQIDALRSAMDARQRMVSQKSVDRKSESQVLPETVLGASSLNWESLRARLNRATAVYGSKARLAREFEVTPQSVGEWLGGESSPTADTTLRLLAWVQAEEAKQQRTPGGVCTTTRGKARSTHSSHEKRRPGPKANLPKKRSRRN